MTKHRQGDHPPPLSGAAGAGALVARRGRSPRSAAQFATVRQGYQTNIWGMPTYYLIKSGVLEKRGIKFEEFAVPSGNLTMQQMVARQVDMGTYAGPSFIIGHDKGGLVAIAVIEICRQDRAGRGAQGPRHHQGRRPQGQEDRQPDRLVDRQHLCRSGRPANGLKKGDFQEVRMDVNNMIAAMAAKTVDAMINIEPYNAIAEADGLGVILMDFSKYDSCRCSWRRRPISSRRTPMPWSPICKAWLDVARRTSRTTRRRSRR